MQCSLYFFPWKQSLLVPSAPTPAGVGAPQNNVKFFIKTQQTNYLNTTMPPINPEDEKWANEAANAYRHSETKNIVKLQWQFKTPYHLI